MDSSHLILASTSPRRRELMRHLGLAFSPISVEVDETPRPREPAAAMVERLSLSKAHAGLSRFLKNIVIAADTTVLLDGEVLGKPADASVAVRMLHALRGRTHVVYSGLAVLSSSRTWVCTVNSTVTMRDYTDTEIEAYVATGDPFDKAAAYAVQHPTFQPVALIKGCFANVMGLPLCRLAHGLAEHGKQVSPSQLGCLWHPEQDCAVPHILGLDL